MNFDQIIKRPSGRVYVCAPTDEVPEGLTPCVLGKHFKLEPRALGTFLCLEIPSRAEDLLVIAGIVMVADAVASSAER